MLSNITFLLSVENTATITRKHLQKSISIQIEEKILLSTFFILRSHNFKLNVTVFNTKMKLKKKKNVVKHKLLKQKLLCIPFIRLKRSNLHVPNLE